MKVMCLFCVCLTLAAPAALKAGSEKANADETEYFAVFMEGKKAGHARQDRVVSDGKVTSSERVSLTISRAGVSLTVTMSVKTIETYRSHLKEKLNLANGAELLRYAIQWVNK